LHLLLTYQCTLACDHCFVFGSPWQTGTMTLELIQEILNQAQSAGWVDWIYFEGGEPFLYYATMLAGINEASNRGFKVGIVTNSYWATSEQDAHLWLSPLQGKVDDLTVSSDLFHFSEKESRQSIIVTKVASQLGIPVGKICIEMPEKQAVSTLGQIPPSSASIMYRGRAADKLTSTSTLYPASLFTTCPHENLEDPGRVHIDPYGNMHICQGIIIGNLLEKSIKDICDSFDPRSHPILGPLLAGGPLLLSEYNHLAHSSHYADACHLCYETRFLLRNNYPNILAPDQMYCDPEK
jgi:hypothetical protein